MTQSELTTFLRTTSGRVEVGAAPGTFFDNPTATPSAITAIGFSPERLESAEVADMPSVQALRSRFPVVWVDVAGLANTDLIRSLAGEFRLHDLAVADVVNIHQRPKVEEYDDHLFVITRMPIENQRLETQQVSLFLARGLLITFSERQSAVFDPIRSRLANPRSSLRAKGADYLAYAVIDAVIDSFFPLMESYGELLEQVETRTIEHPSRGNSREIHVLRGDLLLLRRCAWPLREIVNELTRGTTDLVEQETKIYFRDCYDHAVHVLDTVETYRELAFGLVDLYMASLSSRMNEIMKVLTIIATIFIPLSFIAGVYGMNFDRRYAWNLPELGWPFGYAFALALMATSAGVMLWFFRKKGWIGGGES
ncbi:MAG: magnesium/cobalt transporter CorA [Gammaproteobacteria bacterium]|nr:magnesium/cobalt transporter CorA [Gammaproteobacteria bacterium]MDH3411124.1 magnesium/cobalt transporter CorA [Gammaproteobacteria bacterium]